MSETRMLSDEDAAEVARLDALGIDPEDPEVNQATLVGTVWRTSWGYDQTNVEYFQVIRETPKSVWVREIGQYDQDGRVWPIRNGFLEPREGWRERERALEGKRCSKKDVGGRRPSIRIDDVRNAWPYEGGGAYETYAAGGMGH